MKQVCEHDWVVAASGPEREIARCERCGAYHAYGGGHPEGYYDGRGALLVGEIQAITDWLRGEES